MLDKQSIKILKFIEKNDNVTLKQLKSKFTTIQDIQSYIDFLLKLNFISGTKVPKIIPPTMTEKIRIIYLTAEPYSITPSGRAYLESLEMQEKQELQEKKSKKNQLWLNIMINLACVLLGATIDKLPEIFNWLSSLIVK